MSRNRARIAVALGAAIIVAAGAVIYVVSTGDDTSPAEALPDGVEYGVTGWSVRGDLADDADFISDAAEHGEIDDGALLWAGHAKGSSWDDGEADIALFVVSPEEDLAAPEEGIYASKTVARGDNGEWDISSVADDGRVSLKNTVIPAPGGELVSSSVTGVETLSPRGQATPVKISDQGIIPGGSVTMATRDSGADAISSATLVAPVSSAWSTKEAAQIVEQLSEGRRTARYRIGEFVSADPDASVPGPMHISNADVQATFFAITDYHQNGWIGQTVGALSDDGELGFGQLTMRREGTTELEGSAQSPVEGEAVPAAPVAARIPGDVLGTPVIAVIGANNVEALPKLPEYARTKPGADRPAILLKDRAKISVAITAVDDQHGAYATQILAPDATRFKITRE